MKKLILTLLFLSLPAITYAQSDFDEGNDSFAEDKPSVDKNDEKPIETQLDEAPDKLTAAEPVKANVTSEELKKLAEARKSRSEAAVVRAASDILSKDATHLEALNTLAVFYFETKKLGLAKLILKRALKDHPDEPALHNNLGIIYLSEGDSRLALDSFRKSIQEKANYRIGSTNLSSIYLQYRDYQRSLAPLEASYRATHADLGRGGDNSVEIANNYGIALLGLGENAKAGEVFEEITKSDTRNPAPFLNYAIYLVEVQKKKKDAMRVISKLKFMTEDREILSQVAELEKKLEN